MNLYMLGAIVVLICERQSVTRYCKKVHVHGIQHEHSHLSYQVLRMGTFNSTRTPNNQPRQLPQLDKV